LTSSKYFGESGLEALRAILRHADHYGLKWVFVKDPYYEPLLVFSGWRRVDELENRTIAVWTEDGIPPATPINSPQRPLPWEGLLWGTLPIGSSVLAMLLVLIPGRRAAEQHMPEPAAPVSPQEELVVGRQIA
jgi:hypothetical protein